jgi:hypothetical protein
MTMTFATSIIIYLDVSKHLKCSTQILNGYHCSKNNLLHETAKIDSAIGFWQKLSCCEYLHLIELSILSSLQSANETFKEGVSTVIGCGTP